MNTAALKEYTTEASAGYLGAIKTTGSNEYIADTIDWDEIEL